MSNFDSGIIAMIMRYRAKTKSMKNESFIVELNNKVEYVSLISAMMHKNHGNFQTLSPLNISNGVISHYIKSSKTYNPNKKSYVELVYDTASRTIKVYSWNNKDTFDVNYKHVFNR